MFGVSGFAPSGVQAYVEGQKRSQKKRIYSFQRNPLGFLPVFSWLLRHTKTEYFLIRFFGPDFFNIPFEYIFCFCIIRYLFLYPLKIAGEKRYLIDAYGKHSAVRMTDGVVLIVYVYLNVARQHGGYQRDMPRKNGKVTARAAQADTVHIAAEYLTVGRGYHKRKLLHFASPLAFSTVSSMVPTKRNADSGRSSCLPSIISRKPRMVSDSGT